jgi:indoleamine 2,3-dioxygenase
MHALDIFLDVDHLMQKRARSVLPTAAQKTDPAFFQRMRQYMPRQARNYLESLDALPMTVRDIALRTPSLQEPYNACIEQLRLLRDLHLRIATLYIISMAKTVPPGRDKASVTDEEVRKSFEARSGPSLGTGGNHVSLLLKAGRDATKQAFLDTQVKFPRHQLVRG